MKLAELLKDIEYRTDILPDTDIVGLTDDSRKLAEGYLFCCVAGAHHDGNCDAAAALRGGARALLCERELGVGREIIVPDVRHAYAVICDNFFGNPAREMRLAAVTGTNGKTSTAYMLRHIIENAGQKCGLIGTVSIETGARSLAAQYTTPDSYTLSSLLAEMIQAGCRYCVIEASSQALDQHRLDSCRFDTAVFTNLTQDHLDYHGDIESYFLAKRRLFDMTDFAVINYDDSHGRRLLRELEIPKLSFSLGDDEASLTAKNIEYTAEGTRFVAVGINLIERVSLPYIGEVSAANALAAGLAAYSMHFGVSDISAALATLPQVPGRLEPLTHAQRFTVIRDYAHTPDAIAQLIKALRPLTKHRLILLFGCGGERDAGKRPLMGEAAAGADYVIVTGDNPRGEAPEKIIREILPGLDKHGAEYTIIQDRRTAIASALDMLEEGDLLALAGKGHERYQISGAERIPLDEAEIVREWLEAHSERN